jgi:hypothetical protein
MSLLSEAQAITVHICSFYKANDGYDGLAVVCGCAERNKLCMSMFMYRLLHRDRRSCVQSEMSSSTCVKLLREPLHYNDTCRLQSSAACFGHLQCVDGIMQRRALCPSYLILARVRSMADEKVAQLPVN